MASRAINFREQLSYVTDGANEAHCNGSNGTYSGLVTVFSTDLSGNARDRNSGNDRRLAGIVFSPSGTATDITITLPDGTGDYEFGVALGDGSTYWTNALLELLDNTTSFATIGGDTGGGSNTNNQFFDASDTLRTAAAWPGSQTLITRTMTSTTLVLRLGGAAGTISPIAHLYVNKLTSDTTAPVLTSPTGSATGPTTATVGATTDEGNGTLYAVVTTSATQPSVAQIKAGQNHTGAAAPWGGSVAVSSTGAKTLSATGLTASTAYYAHLVHADAAANDSNRVSSASFTTSSIPGLTSNPLKNNTGTLLTSQPFEAYVSNPSTGALVLKKTGLTSHATTGVVTFTDAALAAATSYRVVWRQTTTGAEGLETLTAA